MLLGGLNSPVTRHVIVEWCRGRGGIEGPCLPDRVPAVELVI